MIDFNSYGEALGCEATISGSATFDDAQHFAKHALTHRLVLNVFRKWDGDLISVVRSFEGIPVRQLSVFGTPNIDVSILQSFNTIEELQISGLVIGTINLDWFPNLKSFNFGAEIKGKVKVSLNWGGCMKLKHIGGLGSKLPSIDMLSRFPSLESLSIVKANWDPEQLQMLEGLTSIDMPYWNKLESIQQLGNLRKRLIRLDLMKSSNLSDYSAITDMQTLRYLSLEKCPPFPTVKLLEPLNLLENLFLIDMKVIDGDLSTLLKMPKLKKVALSDQKHYVPSRSEIYSVLAARRL